MSATTVVSRVRQWRREAGLSQQSLAEQAGVSRQALSAIEAGRQVPSTGLALKLATALNCKVEQLFEIVAPPIRAKLADPKQDAIRVALAQVDGQWVAHALSDGDSAADGLIVAVEGEQASIRALSSAPDLRDNVVVAGCAPLLGMLAGRASAASQRGRATWLRANSTTALRMLSAKSVHLAGLHLVDADAPGGHESIALETFTEPTLIANVARWRQGIVVPRGNPLGIHSAADLARPGLRVARRESGAGAAVLLARLVRTAADLEGPVARSHGEVARLVHWGAADAGVAIEAVALAAGLDFVPLAEERFDLLVPVARAEIPGVAQLLDILDSRAFREEAAHVKGYDVSTAGHCDTVGT